VPLSPLQERVVTVVGALPEAGEFGLAGGAALIAWGIGDRVTHDLDFFAKLSETVDRAAPAVEQALRSDGLDVEVVRVSPGFVRLQIGDGNETTELDLAWDYRMRELGHVQHGRILDRDELAADKMLALYGRAEARDFVDVYRLRSLYSREQLCELAHEKDRGFVTNMFAEALRGIDRRDRFEFDVDATTFAALKREFSEWVRELGIDRRLERNRDSPSLKPPDLGLEP
jgi:hypothetical protein